MYFQVDLAGLYMKTGVKNIPTVLLLTDAQIPEDSFLVIISTLISSGQTLPRTHTFIHATGGLIVCWSDEWETYVNGVGPVK